MCSCFCFLSCSPEGSELRSSPSCGFHAHFPRSRAFQWSVLSLYHSIIMQICAYFSHLIQNKIKYEAIPYLIYFQDIATFPWCSKQQIYLPCSITILLLTKSIKLLPARAPQQINLILSKHQWTSYCLLLWSPSHPQLTLSFRYLWNIW